MKFIVFNNINSEKLDKHVTHTQGENDEFKLFKSFLSIQLWKYFNWKIIVKLNKIVLIKGVVGN